MTDLSKAQRLELWSISQGLERVTPDDPNVIKELLAATRAIARVLAADTRKVRVEAED
jgi:hypothetical protein